MPLLVRLPLAAALALTLLASPAPPQVSAAGAPPRAACAGGSDLVRTADDLLAHRYLLAPHPSVTLPADPTWAEDPFGDRNWQFNFHAMRYVRTLLHAWVQTDDPRYRDRAVFLLQDWLADNPRTGAPSVFSWNDHSTAWRAMTMVCAADLIGLPAWLVAGLTLHGMTLADPDFYVKRGNHALNQAVALLDIGCTLGRSDWMTLARSRLGTLVVDSVDSVGVTNEQSIEYQAYNHRHYSAAQSRLVECGLVPPTGFERVAKMPRFLAHATLPNGEYELVGDTSRNRAVRIVGTIAEFAATKGASGPRPPVADIIFKASGWAFARTGWGVSRPYEDEVHTSLRFGPARQMHGHFDGGSVTLYGYGHRLLLDPGKYKYETSPWRTWFMSRKAHNVVTVDGLAFKSGSATRLLAHRTSSRHTDTTVTTSGYRGVTNQRRVVFSKRLGFLLVEDRLTSTTSRRYRQNWHLADGSSPALGTSGVLTRRERGNLVIRQLIGGTTTRIVSGTTSPIQGWLSYEYGTKLKAPVVEATRAGTRARFLTLIVPGDARPQVRVGSLRLTSTGYSVVVTINGRSEKVTVTSTSSSITNG